MFRNIIVLAIAASALSTTDAVHIERSREVERDLRFKLGGMGKGNKVIDPCVASCQVDFDVCVDTCAPSDCIPLDATASPTKGKGMSMSMGMNKFGMSKGKGKGSSEAPSFFCSEAPSVTPSASPNALTSLVQNGSFEIEGAAGVGDAAEWLESSVFRSNVHPRTQEWHGVWPGTETPLPPFPLFSQTITGIQEGDTLQASAYFKSVAGSGDAGDVRVNIRFVDANGIFRSFSSNALSTPNSEYELFEVTTTVPAGTTSVNLDIVGTTLCFDTDDFSQAITLSVAQQADAWYVDRFAPAGFMSNVSFEGGQRLLHTISANDGASNRPMNFATSFYDTQGRKFDLPSGTQSIEIDLYVPSDWETTGRRMAGLWGTAVNAAQEIAAFPIIEFTSDGDARFRGWIDGDWIDIGLPPDFTYDAFYTLSSTLLESGEFLYTISGSGGSIGAITNVYAANGIIEIANVILQGHNTNAGVNYDIYWDNFSNGSTCSTGTVFIDSVVLDVI